MSVLIRNVKIISGAGLPEEERDVFVSGDRISAVGRFPTKRAGEIIDGQGAYLSPGFIDVNTDSDHYASIFDNPAQGDFLRQGVTTIVGGMCGSSLAPLFYGGLESVRKWKDVGDINVGWHGVREFLDAVDRRRIGVNFLTLAGHSTIRRDIAGDALRDLTKNELGVFAETLRRALREGAFGLSTGLEYVHARGAPQSELKALVGLLAQSGGLYATHLRDMRQGLAASVEETTKLLRSARVPALISHFVPFAGFEAEYEKALGAISGWQGEAPLFFDLYPYNESIRPLYAFLPIWAQNGPIEAMAESVADEWRSKKILREMPAVPPEQVVVSRAAKNGVFVGRNLKEVGGMFGVSDPKEALLRLMRATRLNATMLYRNINEELSRRAMAHPRALIASNSASMAPLAREKMLVPKRAVSTFTKFLEYAAGGLMPLGQAVAKITSTPAKLFGLKGRGAVQEGAYADLAVFSVKTSAGAPAVSVHTVLVNGSVAMKDGVLRSALAGRTIRHASR